MNRLNHIIQQVVDQVQRVKQTEETAPLKVSIMGQTGIGKSSLINALFKANLETSAVEPGTGKIELFRVPKSGYELWFYDLPGIGKSQRSDIHILKQYIKMFEESDIVLWAIHADSRSFSFDLEALNKIFESTNRQHRAQLLSKITFILTKVDLLTPPPWIMAKVANNAVFVPQTATQKLLKQKEEYFQKIFLLPYKDEVISQTFHSGDLDIDPPIPQLHYDKDEGMVYYKGFLDKESLSVFKKQYPKYKSLFERLYDNYRIIPCSSLFRYNLDLLMRVIINKLGADAVTRFSHFYTNGTLNKVPLTKAKKLCNLIVIDQDKKRLIFDLAKSKLGGSYEFT